MTIEVETRTIPERKEIALKATVAGVTHRATITATGYVRLALPLFTLSGADVDAVIELLHAAKAASIDAATSMRRLAETFDATDIIAVDEPTA